MWPKILIFTFSHYTAFPYIRAFRYGIDTVHYHRFNLYKVTINTPESSTVIVIISRPMYFI